VNCFRNPTLPQCCIGNSAQHYKHMKPKIYLETSIISYLAGRRSKDLIVAAHQELTHEWWELRKNKFTPFVSQLVIQEIQAGDTSAARERLRLIEALPSLSLHEAARELASVFLQRKVIPRKAVEDALHIAVATCNGMDYLVTWNCKHIANAEIRTELSRLCMENGFEVPVICTPEELMGG